jgi:hypothetical protein
VPAITFQDFSGGLDKRRDPALAAGNVLANLSNAFITTGKEIRGRPCLTSVATLEAGTVGLRSAGGKLNTFYGQAATITHANSLFRANRVPHPTTGAAPTRIYYGENFNGVLYASVAYASGDIRHHYLDDSTLTAWAAATAYTVGLFRRPITANGFRYEVTSISGSGTSHATTEPTWPTTIGSTVTDNAGANQVVWTCRSNAITDANCPHTRQVRKLAQKIYAADSPNVAFTKTSDPRDWTTANDAGFVPSGLSAPGDDTVKAVGDFGGDLAIFYADSLQVWDVDADPANNALKNSSTNTGAIHADTAQALAGDLIFLSQQGFRSASLIAITDNLQENDVGSAIDALRSDIADDDDPVSIYYPKLGQMWCMNVEDAETKVYVYAFSRAVKLSAWQTFTLPITVDAAAVLNNQLYVRAGDEVYRVDDTNYADDHTSSPTPPLVEIEMFYQDAKTPGVLKMFTGFDGVMTGSAEIAFKWQEKLEDGTIVENTTGYTPVTGDLRPGALHPMELCSVSVAPIIRHRANEQFKLSQLQLHYENLGAV